MISSAGGTIFFWKSPKISNIFLYYLIHRLKNDRSRQEQLARERLERLRNKKNSQSKDKVTDDASTIVEEGGDKGQGNLVKLLGQRHELEQNVRIKQYYILFLLVSVGVFYLLWGKKNNAFEIL